MVILQATPPLAQGRATEIDSGKFDLSQLGLGTIDFPVGKTGATSRTAITFPAGAQQGWGGTGPVYVLSLDVVVALKRGSAPGTAYIAGAVNGCGAVQIRVAVPRGPAAGHGATWHAIGYLEGPRGGRFENGRAKIHVANYLPSCSVRGGKGSLSLEFERYGHLGLKRVVVLKSSAIEVTRTVPAELELTPLYPEATAYAGRPFRVGFRLQNIGERPAQDVRVELETRGENLAVVGRRELHFSRVRKTVTGYFTLRGDKVAEQPVDLVVSSANTNSPAAEIDVRLDRAPPGGASGQDPWWPVLGIVLAAALLTGFGAFRLRTRSRRSGSSS